MPTWETLKFLSKDGIEATAIHGNKAQNARNKALDSFRSGRVRVLVATDIAARGIDVTGISHVINYELPDEAESYVHRRGRAPAPQKQASERAEALEQGCVGFWRWRPCRAGRRAGRRRQAQAQPPPPASRARCRLTGVFPAR